MGLGYFWWGALIVMMLCGMLHKTLDGTFIDSTAGVMGAGIVGGIVAQAIGSNIKKKQ